MSHHDDSEKARRERAIGGGTKPSFEDDSQRSWTCGCYEDQHGYHLCLKHLTLTGAAPASAPPEGKPRGYLDGVLYCYGGCGRKYRDFGLDIHIPTGLWNRIATGAPFDETQDGVEREGRGGVLCAQCIVDRFAKLPDATYVHMSLNDRTRERSRYKQGEREFTDRLAALSSQLEASQRREAALRKLAEKWDAKAERHAAYGDCYRRGQGWGLKDCADELRAALAEKDHGQ